MLLEGAGKGYRGDQVGALISETTEWKSGTTEWKSGTTHASSHSPYTQGWESAPHFQVWLVDCGPTRGPVMMAEVRVDVNRRGHDR